MITMRKSTHGFPFVSHIWVAYGAPLGGPSGRRSSAINLSKLTNRRELAYLDKTFRDVVYTYVPRDRVVRL